MVDRNDSDDEQLVNLKRPHSLNFSSFKHDQLIDFLTWTKLWLNSSASTEKRTSTNGQCKRDDNWPRQDVRSIIT